MIILKTPNSNVLVRNGKGVKITIDNSTEYDLTGLTDEQISEIMIDPAKRTKYTTKKREVKKS